MTGPPVRVLRFPNRGDTDENGDVDAGTEPLQLNGPDKRQDGAHQCVHHRDDAESLRATFLHQRRQVCGACLQPSA